MKEHLTNLIKQFTSSNTGRFLIRVNPFNEINAPKLKTAVSIYPAVAAVILAFYKDHIVDATRLARRHFKDASTCENCTVDWLVTLYWALLLFWCICYFWVLSGESSTSKRRNQELTSAILKAPNPKIFDKYNELYLSIMKQIDILNTPTEKKAYELVFREVLDLICELTENYANISNSKVIYGANIMLYIPTQQNKDIVEGLRMQSDWLHFENIKTEKIAGVLRLPLALNFTEKDHRGAKTISLPVFVEGETNGDLRLNLPGAPKAVLDAEYIINDVSDVKLYEFFDVKEKETAHNYWNNTAKEIKSVLSLSIPRKWNTKLKYNHLNVVGVLNIDSTEPFILGKTTEYHPTFMSLIYPVLCQLSPHLVKYFDMYISDVEKDGIF